MFKHKNKKHKKFYGFTLVELIIVITILAILATISFVSFSGYTSKSRDSNRLFSLKEISKALEIQKEMTGNYPQPDDIYAKGGIPTLDNELFSVGLIGKNVSNYVKLGLIPLDPKTGNEYLYGLTRDNKNFQIAGTLENLQSSMIIPVTYADNGMQAVVEGNYKGVIKFSTGSSNYIGNIPSLIFSRTGTYETIQKRFVINKGKNLPYSVDGESLGTGLGETEVLKELHNKDSLTLTGVIITNPKSEEEIKKISDELGVSDIIVAENLGNKEYIEKYADKGGSSGGENSGGNIVLKLVDFEQENQGYTVTEGTFERTTTNKFEGDYSFMSTNHTNSSTSCFEINTNFNQEIYVDFNYYVSSENGYDFLKFYIDGVEKMKFSGETQGWLKYSKYTTDSGEGEEEEEEGPPLYLFKNIFIGKAYGATQENIINKPIPAGEHIFKWCYSKDYIESSGNDNVLIDNIKFLNQSPIGTCSAQPNYNNATFITGMPDILNQSWQNTNPNGGCYYECNLGYGGNDCSQIVELSFYDKLFYDLKTNNIKFSYYSLFDETLFSYNNSPNYYIEQYTGGSKDGIFRDMSKNPIKDIIIPRKYIGKVGNKVYYTNSNRELISYDLITGDTNIMVQYKSNMYTPKDGILTFKHNVEGSFYIDLGDGNITKINNGGIDIGTYFGKDSNFLYYSYNYYNQRDKIYKVSLQDFTVSEITSNNYDVIKEALLIGNDIYVYGVSGFMKYSIASNSWTTIDSSNLYSRIITDGTNIFLENADLGIYRYNISGGTFSKIFNISNRNITKFFEHKGKIYYYRYAIESGINYDTFIYDLNSGTLNKSTKAFVESTDGQTLFEIIDKTSLIEYGDGYQKTRTGLNINTEVAM